MNKPTITVEVPSRAAFARYDYDPYNTDLADRVPCPVCGKPSWLLRHQDGVWHDDGTDVQACWLAIRSGRNDTDLVVIPVGSTKPARRYPAAAV